MGSLACRTRAMLRASQSCCGAQGRPPTDRKRSEIGRLSTHPPRLHSDTRRILLGSAVFCLYGGGACHVEEPRGSPWHFEGCRRPDCIYRSVRTAFTERLTDRSITCLKRALKKLLFSQDLHCTKQTSDTWIDVVDRIFITDSIAPLWT